MRIPVVPVTMSFNHNVFHILAHVSEKFRGHRIQDRRDIIFLVLDVPAAHSRAAAGWRVRSGKSTIPFVKSFYPPVYHEPAQGSASWFVHGCHDGRDIEATVTATAAVQQTAVQLVLQSHFPVIQCLKSLALLPQHTPYSS
jgi:hypothetical protein